MTNEAVLKNKFSEPIDFIVADGTGIEKGTVLKISTPRTAAASGASGDIFAGIAHREKIANDGRTRLALIAGPGDIVSMTCDGVGVTVGDLVKIGGANLISTWTGATDAVAGDMEKLAFGKALETGAASATIEVKLI